MLNRSLAIGATTKVLKRLITAIGTLVVIGISGCGDMEREARARADKIEADKAVMLAEAANKAAEACVVTVAKINENYQKLFVVQKYIEAADLVRNVGAISNSCLKGSDSQSMIADAEVRHYKKLFADKGASARAKLVALDLFTKGYPEDSKPFENLRPVFSKQAERDARAVDLAAAKAKAAEAKAEASRRKKEGVSIGMTQEEVIASSWGKPQSVNRTTGTWGTHEQWVYGGKNYLYFENGTLSSIQN